MMPDVKLEIKKIWVAETAITAKGRLTGTLKGNFLGVETDGTKS